MKQALKQGDKLKNMFRMLSGCEFHAKTIKNKIERMKIRNKIIGLLTIFLSFFMSGCDKYLDIEGDKQLSFEDIWTKRTTILQYYANTWSYVLPDYIFEDNHPYTGASDEALLSYKRDFNLINNGGWSPTSVPYSAKLWPWYYKGIREANIFLSNVDKSTAIDVTADDIKRWKAEVRFVRAYYYFLLYRLYGPFIIVGDDPVDFSQTSYKLTRNTLDECTTYIVNELTTAAADLPDYINAATQSSDLGRPTKGICLALIGRVKLYAARPLYNGNTLYANVKNPDGTALFPQAYSVEKWASAAAANKAFIDFSESNNYYKLYTEGDGSNPYLNYQNTFIVKWNSEIIFGRYGNRYYHNVLLTPRSLGGVAYGGAGPTQLQVDAYAMSNGKYPITGYNADGTPIIDATTGYSESGFANFTHPIENNTQSTYKMFVGREPRFYVSVLWSGAKWVYTGSNYYPNFASGGDCGIGGNDYPPSGYLTRKFSDPSSNTASGIWGNFTYPVIRLAEVYLNYVEALNESDPANPDIFKYINMIRTRSGMPNIEKVYPEVANGGNQTKMRELIRHERQIELFFECHRFFDTRQWMIAKQTSNGNVYGMNVYAPVSTASGAGSTPAAFWKRTVVASRIFSDKCYLFPILQTELNKDPNLVQNYGW